MTFLLLSRFIRLVETLVKYSLCVQQRDALACWTVTQWILVRDALFSDRVLSYARLR